MDIIFGNSNRMEIMRNMVEDAIINKVKISYTINPSNHLSIFPSICLSVCIYLPISGNYE